MSTTDKKRRREVNRALGNYLFVFQGSRFPLKAGEPAAQMLLEFASPLFRLVAEPSTALAIAVTSWYMSLLPEAERPPVAAELVTKLFPERPDLHQTLRELMVTLVERKLTYYRDEPIVYVPRREVVGKTLVHEAGTD